MSPLLKSMCSQISLARLSRIYTYPSLLCVNRSALTTNCLAIPCSVKDTNLFRRRYHADGFIKKVKEKMKFTIHGYPTHVLGRSGLELYDHIEGKLESEVFDFLRVCELPDTMQSWFIVNELHVWMLSVRLMSLDAPGKEVRKHVMQSLWKDVQARVKKVGKSSTSIRQDQVKELGFQLFHGFWSYDEALNGDDKVLAAALWCRFLDNTKDNGTLLETLVHYVRKNLYILENIPKEVFLEEGNKSQIVLASVLDIHKLRIKS